MISRTSEYALRATTWLAAQDGAPQTAKQIAAATQVPTGYLSKVMLSLANAGIVNSQRGLGGGFVLARPAGKISVLDVINAVDPIIRIRKCPLNMNEHVQQLCPLHRKLDAALATIERAFAESSVFDLIDPAARETPLCAPSREHQRPISLKNKNK